MGRLISKQKTDTQCGRCSIMQIVINVRLWVIWQTTREWDVEYKREKVRGTAVDKGEGSGVSSKLLMGNMCHDLEFGMFSKLSPTHLTATTNSPFLPCKVVFPLLLWG